MRTLIVDDSSVMRKVVERALRQAGIGISELHEAANGRDALEVLRKQDRFDLIVSDINMPEMDGLAFLEQRKTEGLAPGVPVVMITTEASQGLVMRALAAGARGYLCKPFTADQVKARVMPLLAAPMARTDHGA